MKKVKESKQLEPRQDSLTNKEGQKGKSRVSYGSN